jgi:hypothetical protein
MLEQEPQGRQADRPNDLLASTSSSVQQSFSLLVFGKGTRVGGPVERDVD